MGWPFPHIGGLDWQIMVFLLYDCLRSLFSMLFYSKSCIVCIPGLNWPRCTKICLADIDCYPVCTALCMDVFRVSQFGCFLRPVNTLPAIDSSQNSETNRPINWTTRFIQRKTFVYLKVFAPLHFRDIISTKCSCLFTISLSQKPDI